MVKWSMSPMLLRVSIDDREAATGCRGQRPFSSVGDGYTGFVSEIELLEVKCDMLHTGK